MSRCPLHMNSRKSWFPGHGPRGWTGWAALLMLSAMLAACGTVGNQSALVVGNQYEGFIPVGAGGTQVPLPEGKWLLVGTGTHAGRKEISGILIRTEQTRVSRLIDFYVPSGPPMQDRDSINWQSVYKFCSRNDVIHMGESETFTSATYHKGLGFDRQHCWGINHWPMTFSGSVPEHFLALRDYVEKNDLELPVTMITAQYRRSGRGKFMSLNYYFNPELEGFAPPQQADWLTSDWHRDRYYRDPEKRAYIEKLKKWATEWDSQVDKGFRGVLR